MLFAPADSPKYVVLIVVDEPSVQGSGASLIAAPYVKEVMEQALRYGNVQPSETAGDVAEVVVPDVTGLDIETARSQIEALGLTCIADGTGQVTRQTPAANEKAAAGGEVTLYTDTPAEPAEPTESGNSEMDTVPDVRGMTMIEARDTLEAAGFEIDIRSSGKAVRQTPAAGETAEKGSMVTVYFHLDLDVLPQNGE